MTRSLKRGWQAAWRMGRDDTGAIAVLWALLIPIVLGFTALGVEVGFWYMEKRDVQSLADAAAYAAALEVKAGTGNEMTIAQAEADRNGFDDSTDTLAFNSPPVVSSAYAGDTSAVEVVVTRSMSPMLSSVLTGSSEDITIQASSVVKVETSTDDDDDGDGDDDSTGDACILALIEDEKGIEFQGSTTVNAGGCYVAANSTADGAIEVWGNATVTANTFHTVGEMSVGGSAVVTTNSIYATGGFSNSGTVTTSDGGDPTVSTLASVVADPFASVTAPTVTSSCDSGFGALTVNPSQSKIINPGQYCGDWTIKGTMTMMPGTYIIRNGDFDVNSTANINGTGVTIYLGGPEPGKISINGNSNVTLTAPTSGTYSGLLFWSHNTVYNDHKFNGGATMSLQGALYFPNQVVDFSGNSSTASCIKIVASMIKFTGNSSMGTTNCSSAGVAEIPVDTSVAGDTTTTVKFVE